jgi:hypothetical protein
MIKGPVSEETITHFSHTEPVVTLTLAEHLSVSLGSDFVRVKCFLYPWEFRYVAFSRVLEQ